MQLFASISGGIQLIKKFASYYKPHIWLFILDMSCAFLISAADLIYPMVTRYFINDVIPNREISIIFHLGLVLAALYIMRLFLQYVVGYYGHVLGVSMEYDMRNELFSHIQTLSFNYFDNTKTGEIMSRVVTDLFDIAEVAHHGPEDLFLSVIKIVGSFVLLCSINVKLTLIVFTIVPIMFCFMVIFNTRLEVAFRKLHESMADINSRVEDTITGIRVVKSFTNEKHEERKFNKGSSIYKTMRTRAVKYIAVFDSGTDFFLNIAMVITLVSGGYFVATNRINTGDLVAYVIYITQFLQPLSVLLRFIEQYQQGMAGFRRFQDVLAIKPDIVDSKDAGELKNVRGDIKFCNVKFSYDDKKSVLSNINLSVRSGETVAIVGPSGVGKTTLCSLIPRFYEVDEGSISIDGKDIRDVTLKSLRQNIGIVQQDVFLFFGTVRENIAYGKLNATDEEIIDAAKAANAHDFIMEMPEGYDTYIGERGVKLSGGQKQRLSIARMFLKNPPVLILDEATSSLDNYSESIIQKSVEALSKNRTTFIIAHRLATIRNAGRIVVITENGIEEQGTHDELIARKGAYYDLYNSQFQSLDIE